MHILRGPKNKPQTIHVSQAIILDIPDINYSNLLIYYNYNSYYYIIKFNPKFLIFYILYFKNVTTV